jgi:hypothetical protein
MLPYIAAPWIRHGYGSTEIPPESIFLAPLGSTNSAGPGEFNDASGTSVSQRLRPGYLRTGDHPLETFSDTTVSSHGFFFGTNSPK